MNAKYHGINRKFKLETFTNLLSTRELSRSKGGEDSDNREDSDNNKKKKVI